jgi:hypothetical protein
MAKKKFEVDLYSYGEYSIWDNKSKNIPKLLAITDIIKAAAGTEFGYVLRIKKAKGKIIRYRIDHPPFKDKNGQVEPPFSGEVRITSNDYHFFLGDSVWEPIETKLGNWTLTSYIDEALLMQKTLRLVSR